MEKTKKYSSFIFLLVITLAGSSCNSENLPTSPQSSGLSSSVLDSYSSSVESFENSGISPLASYVPNWEEMTLVHTTKLIHIQAILESGELTSSSRSSPVFSLETDNAKPDWTTLIYTQVVNKSSLNAWYFKAISRENSVMIELDLNLLIQRSDYTVAHNMNRYYGARFEIDMDKFPNQPILNTEVAEGDQPDNVKAMLEKDFTAHYSGEMKGYYCNEVIFRKGSIDLRGMDLKLHFQNPEQLKAFMTLAPEASLSKYWTYSIASEQMITLTHR